MSTIQISPEAALRETLELVEHYRNRNLILAERACELERALAAARAELDALRPPEAPAGPHEGDD